MVYCVLGHIEISLKIGYLFIVNNIIIYRTSVFMSKICFDFSSECD